jgi:hypothetical protein
MIDNVVINARALSIITAMADVPREIHAAHMIIRLDLDKYVYNINVREYRKDNQRWIIQRNWQHRTNKTKKNKT